MALFSAPASLAHCSSHWQTHKTPVTLGPKRPYSVIFSAASGDNGGSAVAISVAEEQPKAEAANGSVAAASATKEEEAASGFTSFKDPRWVNGTWELKQFERDGKTHWDAVIDAGEGPFFPPFRVID